MEDTTREQDLINHNIKQAEAVLYEAGLVNKGRYAHDINATMHKLRGTLKLVKRKPSRDSPFYQMCKQKQVLASLLFLLDKGL